MNICLYCIVTHVMYECMFVCFKDSYCNDVYIDLHIRTSGMTHMNETEDEK